jgi:hypothetical protein
MSGTDAWESWEHGSDQQPPAPVASLLRPGENLLWAECLKSSATSGASYRLGVLHLALSALCAAAVPWGESLADYCGPDPTGRCHVLFYLGPWFLLFAAAATVYYFWSGWKASHRPWLITYAISTKRAFIIDLRQPENFRYSYLRLDPAKLGAFKTVQFGASSSTAFVGLSPSSTARALYWATEGRLRPEFQALTTT